MGLVSGVFLDSYTMPLAPNFTLCYPPHCSHSLCFLPRLCSYLTLLLVSVLTLLSYYVSKTAFIRRFRSSAFVLIFAMPDCTNLMPPHILDHILGFLKPSDSALATRLTQNWKRDLLACSHVSKSWHRLALQHLFANYALRFEGCDPTLEFDIQLGTYSPTSRNLRRFERFIKDSPASFAAVMKHLSLTMARTIEDYNTYLDPTALRLMRLLNALPSLSSLRLGDVCLNSVFDTTPALFEYLPPVALDRLYISYSHRPVRPSQLLHLLGCFGVVSELHLEDFELDVLSCDEITTDPWSLRVSSLFIWNMKNIRDLTHHFGSGTWTDCLESLYVAGIYSDGARMLSWLVCHWASLRYLTLNMDAMYSELERAYTRHIFMIAMSDAV